MHVIHDFNATLCNLGRNRQSLEEGSFLGSQAGVLSRNDDISWSNSPSPGRGSNLVFQQSFSHISQVTRGEHESNVSADMGQQPEEKLIRHYSQILIHRVFILPIGHFNKTSDRTICIYASLISELWPNLSSHEFISILLNLNLKIKLTLTFPRLGCSQCVL